MTARARRLAALLLALCAAPAAADEGARVATSALAGSERLRLFAFGKALETGALPPALVGRMKRDMVRQGFYHEPGQTPLIALDAWAAPVLSYDGNINGGAYNDRLSVDGIIFETTPEYVAKAGIVAGVGAGGEARLAWDSGRYVSAALRAETVWAPEHDIGRGYAELRVCSDNHLTGWTFLDLCHTEAVLNRELDRSETALTKISAEHLFETGAGYHALTTGLEQRDGSTRQMALELGVESLWDGAVTEVALSLGEEVPGETVQRLALGAGIRWHQGRHPMGLSLGYQEAEGGQFLGQDRTDRRYAAALVYQVSPSVTLGVDLARNDSTVAFFDYDEVGVTATFSGFRW
ncbi:hypothetical protein [Frigidibacter sp.]|uniref:hypothetical protein n=1 Tax=Frigidibacter sp. TaxID=2586418 RepID=UPI002734A5ED|nr:hypothetical protein [Frigidibacter sp.]MDP3341999.1 hypothetical protein [Frigidibacter sp.]